MAVHVNEIRQKLVFTAGLRQLTLEKHDQDPGSGSGPLPMRVRMVNAAIQLHPELDPTELWTYDGLYPGKIFVFRKDQRVDVEWVNEIDGTLPFSAVSSGYQPLDNAVLHPENEPGSFDGGMDGCTSFPCKAEGNTADLPAWTVVHLHGARVAPDSDGWTENAFLPRKLQEGSQHSHYPHQPRSMMLWYHDHAYATTRLNVYSGLAGGWVIRDAEEAALKLPSGDFEIPLIIQDRNFETKGDYLGSRFLHKVESDADKFQPTNDNPTPTDTAEFFGPFTLVNGSLWPSVEVKLQPYRFRLLNGSNARTYQLILVDDQGNICNDLIRQIGTDAGLLGTAVNLASLTYPAGFGALAGKPKGLILAPAERADVIVDFQLAPGRKLRWVNVAAAPYDGIYAGVDSTDPNATYTPIDPTLDPASIHAMTARLPYPEVIQFAVEKGNVGKEFPLPAILAPSFERWTHSSAALHKHNHRWLALNEKSKGPDKRSGFLFFNELIDLDPSDPRQEDFSIFFDGVLKRFLNRPVMFRSPINFYPSAGKPEVWNIVNLSADTHPIHIHLVDFQILERQAYMVAGSGGSANTPNPANIVDAVNSQGLLVPDPKSGVAVLIPDPALANDTSNLSGVDANEAGWKDTVRVNPNEIVSIGMVFLGFTGRFMYHCHILEHEDMDMMRPFVVVPEQLQPILATMDAMMGGGSPGGGMGPMPGM